VSWCLCFGCGKTWRIPRGISRGISQGILGDTPAILGGVRKRDLQRRTRHVYIDGVAYACVRVDGQQLLAELTI
jgi:hypothetical protein